MTVWGVWIDEIHQFKGETMHSEGRTAGGRPVIRRQRRSKTNQDGHEIMMSNRKKRNRAAARAARKSRRVNRRHKR